MEVDLRKMQHQIERILELMLDLNRSETQRVWFAIAPLLGIEFKNFQEKKQPDSEDKE